jgi:hypothetical protein
VDALKTVEDDFVRVWLETRVLLERTLTEGFLRCRDAVRGGRERSCLIGSVVVAVLGTLFEDDRCSPPLVGLPILAREGGGCMPLPLVLPAELGGLEDVFGGLRVEGFTGSLLGDWLLLSMDFASGCRMLLSIDSEAEGRPYLLFPGSAGLRSERVREGIVVIFVVVV